MPGKSHGWRSLVGCSPWGSEEWDTTEQLHFHFLLSCFGEGNGHPLQCSCLENPGDRGAWWAAAYGVAQSRTRRKRLSSSSRRIKIPHAERCGLKKRKNREKQTFFLSLCSSLLSLLFQTCFLKLAYHLLGSSAMASPHSLLSLGSLPPSVAVLLMEPPAAPGW